MMGGRKVQRCMGIAAIAILAVLLPVCSLGATAREGGAGPHNAQQAVSGEGGDDSRAVPLTREEAAWLREHPVLKLGVDPAWPPYELIDPAGRYSGIAADYVKLISGRLSIGMEVQPGLSWEQVLAGLQEKTLDLAPAITLTPERTRYLLFTQPYIKYSVAVVTRLDHGSIEGLTSLAGKTVALVKGYSFTELTLASQSDVIPMYVDTVLDGLNKVSKGEAEAVVSDLPSLIYKISEYNFLNLKVAGIAPFETEGQRMGVRDDWPILVSILDKALASITPEEHQQIRQKWIGVGAAEDAAIDLSPEERQWLASHPVIRNAADAAWAPVEFVDDRGRRSGITSEYLSRLEQMLHVRFETPSGMSWAEMMDELKDGRLHMASCVRDTPQRRSFMHFTEPYLSIPTVIFTRTDVNYADLTTLKGHLVAAVEGYAVRDFLAEEYPEIVLVPVRNLEHGLNILSEGRAYAYIDALAPGSYALNRLGFRNIHVVGETPFRYEMSMAASKQQPVLASILQKAIRAIPEADRNRFFEKWATVPVAHRPDHSLIWKILAGAAVLLLVFFYWNRRLSVEVAERGRAEAALREAKSELEQRVAERTAELEQRNVALAEEVLERKRVEESLRESESRFTQLFQSAPVPMAYASDADGYRGTTWNEAWYQTFRYPREQAEGRSGADIGLWVDPDDRSRFVEMAKRHHDVTGFETLLRRHDGAVLDCSLFGRFIGRTGHRLLMAVYLDITERKRAEEALRDSMQRLQTVVNGAPVVLYSIDRDGVFTLSEGKGLAGLGLEPGEIVGKTIYEIYGDQPEAIAALRRAMAGETFVLELSFPAGGAFEASHIALLDDKGDYAGTIGVLVDITERKRAENELRSSLEEKESLLKEVHHRVKNNLQVISSLLKLQSRKAQSPEVLGFLRDTQNRVRSMALLHETLYRSGNLAKVGFPQYVKSVCAHVARSYASDAVNVRLRHEVAEVTLDLDRAIPAGLIISELVSNAFKHAFPHATEGEVLVELKTAPEDMLVLRVADSGVGFPAEFDPESPETLGLLLVRNLTRQLEGRMTISGDKGTVFEIVFPKHCR